MDASGTARTPIIPNVYGPWDGGTAPRGVGWVRGSATARRDLSRSGAAERFRPSPRPDAPEIRVNQTKSGLEARVPRPQAPEITSPWVSDTRLTGTLALLERRL
ncbi:hypothetical protein SBV1_1890010 [Verrucomicrobia bacterium]|nr:hypothetical protein SBV1_1890010 [Verrucomicrobiota bacterium]